MKKTQKNARPFQLCDNLADIMPIYDPEENLYNDPYDGNSLTFNNKTQTYVMDADFAKKREFERFDEF